MTETIYSLVTSYGIWVVAASAFLSCLLVPIPTALVMLAAGAFAAAGDLVLWQVWLAGWLAALGFVAALVVKLWRVRRARV